MLNSFYVGVSFDDDSISVNSAFKALLPQSSNWYKVGIECGLTTQALSQISVKRKSKDISLMEVVRHWFQNNPNPNWASLLSKGHVIIKSKYPISVILLL